MRILVTGREGQVVSALRAMAPPDVELISLARPEIDLADGQALADAVERAHPDVVISAAAWTAVDAAETQPQQAFAVNADGPRHLARGAARLGVPIVHLSTDYVFDGRGGAPYGEDHDVNPLGVYGRSKLAGEAAVRQASDNHVILRTSWVHAPTGSNFVRTMLRFAVERERFRVVDDQRGTPTAAHHLAPALLQMARRLHGDPSPDLRGIFHLTNSGDTTWAGLASEIFRQSAELGGPTALVEPIPTSAYPTPAPRPADSRLATTRIAQRYGIVLPPWQEGVAATIGALAPSWQQHKRRIVA
jgi:dTDP-4-dehydrorhamnose reductase